MDLNFHLDKQLLHELKQDSCLLLDFDNENNLRVIREKRQQRLKSRKMKSGKISSLVQSHSANSESSVVKLNTVTADLRVADSQDVEKKDSKRSVLSDKINDIATLIVIFYLLILLVYIVYSLGTSMCNGSMFGVGILIVGAYLAFIYIYDIYVDMDNNASPQELAQKYGYDLVGNTHDHNKKTVERINKPSDKKELDNYVAKYLGLTF